MKIETSLNARDRAIRNLESAYATAALVGQTQQQLSQKVIDIESSVKAYPQWVRAYVKGYNRCLWENLYKNSLVFGAVINGVFYSTHSDREDYYQKHAISASDFCTTKNKLSGHYWKTTKQPKPFFLGEN